MRSRNIGAFKSLYQVSFVKKLNHLIQVLKTDELIITHRTLVIQINISALQRLNEVYIYNL